MKPNRGTKRIVPQSGGVSSQTIEVGPGGDEMPMPEGGTRLRWGDGGRIEKIDPNDPTDLDPNRSMIPSAQELAQLPGLASLAFSTRCACRVRPMLPSNIDTEHFSLPETVQALLSAAHFNTPVHKQLRCIRRDFDRLVFLAKKHNWTDDTPVPQEVFGPMWPEGLTPEWAMEPTPSA